MYDQYTENREKYNTEENNSSLVWPIPRLFPIIYFFCLSWGDLDNILNHQNNNKKHTYIFNKKFGIIENSKNQAVIHKTRSWVW